jgi:hypothetical protein
MVENERWSDCVKLTSQLIRNGQADFKVHMHHLKVLLNTSAITPSLFVSCFLVGLSTLAGSRSFLLQ